jgi:hypothetical protein
MKYITVKQARSLLANTEYRVRDNSGFNAFGYEFVVVPRSAGGAGLKMWPEQDILVRSRDVKLWPMGER